MSALTPEAVAGAQGSGASVPDRAAVPSASSPAVSTVPASIPSAEDACRNWLAYLDSDESDDADTEAGLLAQMRKAVNQ